MKCWSWSTGHSFGQTGRGSSPCMRAEASALHQSPALEHLGCYSRCFRLLILDKSILTTSRYVDPAAKRRPTKSCRNLSCSSIVCSLTQLPYVCDASSRPCITSNKLSAETVSLRTLDVSEYAFINNNGVIHVHASCPQRLHDIPVDTRFEGRICLHPTDLMARRIHSTLTK